jgi:hypothetical protein
VTVLDQRRLRILAAIGEELRRQGRIDPRDVDLEALAAAVDAALVHPATEDIEELSRDLDELNAANDV